MRLNSLLGAVEAELLNKHEVIVRQLFYSIMEKPESRECVICSSLRELYKYPQLSCEAGAAVINHTMLGHDDPLNWALSRLEFLRKEANLIDQYQVWKTAACCGFGEHFMYTQNLHVLTEEGERLMFDIEQL
jgi:hypothetical protein